MRTTVVVVPFQRAPLGEMAEQIREVIYAYANRVSLAEALGVLEIVKQEVYTAALDDAS